MAARVDFEQKTITKDKTEVDPLDARMKELEAKLEAKLEAIKKLYDLKVAALIAINHLTTHSIEFGRSVFASERLFIQNIKDCCTRLESIANLKENENIPISVFSAIRSYIEDDSEKDLHNIRMGEFRRDRINVLEKIISLEKQRHPELLEQWEKAFAEERKNAGRTAEHKLPAKSEKEALLKTLGRAR